MSFLDCLLVSVANGMADALVSGTDEALMYDSLQACGQVARFQEVCNSGHSVLTTPLSSPKTYTHMAIAKMTVARTVWSL